MSTEETSSIVVIGIGNSLRGDDAVGCQVIEQLPQDWPNVVTQVVPQILPELAIQVAEARAVIFVDACVDGSDEVEVRELYASIPSTHRLHATSPGELLGFARDCFGRAPAAWLVTIPASEFECTEQLSADVERHLPEAVAAVEQLVDQIMHLELPCMK